MSTSANPYEPPRSVDRIVKPAATREHEWRGRHFVVSARAAAPVLWMGSVIVVCIDDSETYFQSVFQADGNYRFEFPHEGRMVEGQVRRRWGFIARRISYELMVGGERVGSLAQRLRIGSAEWR